MSNDWKKVSTSKDGQEYIPCELSKGPRSTCRAVFFRNQHGSSGEYIISLKVSRWKSIQGKWNESEEKKVTLNEEELGKLINFIEENYKPLNLGMTEFISVEDDTAYLLSKVHDLGLTDAALVEQLYEAGILSDNLSVAIEAAERKKAIEEFEQVLSAGEAESFWQKWFEKNKWILGSEYLAILPEREINTEDIADYLVKSVDGFIDVVEIKKPAMRFWNKPDSHGNYCPSAELTSAIMQCLNYLYKIERESNSLGFAERMGGTKTVKPQCMLVYGRSDDWDDKKHQYFRILNSAYPQLNIITYDQLLLRAKQLLGIGSDDDDIEELPF